MQAAIQKWGNSLALRIPKAVAEQIGVEKGGIVALDIGDGALHIRPVAPVTLDALLANVTDDDCHDETPTGASVGREAW